MNTKINNKNNYKMNSKNLQVSNTSEIEKLVELLCNDDGHKRKKARQKLVALGENTLEYVTDLLEHPKHICRWEAMKVIEEIGMPESIPVFIEALDDDKSDIRWIAAEGLIRLGKYSLEPLLKEVTENYDSVFVLNGAHHVISELEVRKNLPKNFPAKKLLKLLKKPSMEASLKILVHNTLNEFKKVK